MNLATLYARRGQAGLEDLAAACGWKVDYMQRLLYVLDRRPSADRAMIMIKESGRLFGRHEALTLDGLTHPENYLVVIEREIAAGNAHPTHLLRHSRRLAEEKGRTSSRDPRADGGARL